MYISTNFKCQLSFNWYLNYGLFISFLLLQELESHKSYVDVYNVCMILQPAKCPSSIQLMTKDMNCWNLIFQSSVINFMYISTNFKCQLILIDT
jgi:hypothetical protein